MPWLNQVRFKDKNRQVADRVDTPVLVADFSYWGVQTVHHIEEFVKDGAVPACDTIGVVFNRIQGDNRSEQDLTQAVGLPAFDVVPYDPELGGFDAEGRSLLSMPEDAVSVQSVKAALTKILGHDIE